MIKRINCIIYKIETAKILLKENVPLDIICKATCQAKEEIEKL